MNIVFAIIGFIATGSFGWHIGRLRGYEDRMADEQRRYNNGKYGK